MFRFYAQERFKLFPCNIDKSPRVPSWRSTDAHIDVDSADKIASHGGYIGAWLPKNYIVIDIDRHEGKPDGLPVYQDLCRQLEVPEPNTLTIKTGSGGYHLYFKLPPDTDYKTLSQKSIATSLDVRTHLGYVIAAGTNGYTVENNVDPAPIPDAFLTLIQTRNKNKAELFEPQKQLPVEMLKKVLAKVPVSDFTTNDDWQEFITSCIAVSGNSDEVLTAIEDWSRSDPAYARDTSIRKRLETFEPSGGITVGTFLHILKKEQISKYLIDKVRAYVGAQFNFTEAFTDIFEPPFKVDYGAVTEHKELASAYYYDKSPVAAVELFAQLTKGNILYVVSERSFFYFDENRWIEQSGVMKIMFSVLANAMLRFYSDYSKRRDADADDYLNAIISYTASYAVLTRYEAAMRQHSLLAVQKVDWDAPELAATLTLDDCVMDFSQGQKIYFRSGKREEYRRLYIDLTKDELIRRKTPDAFKAFLKDVFPNDETRKTATYALSTMLSGTGKFRKFQLWNGAGSNGKSTLMEIMKYVIGERAISYKPEVLLNKTQTQSLTPELAMFRGVLAAFSSETEESKRISQGAVKALTGDETIVANPKYKDVIEFRTTFQLVLSTNYLPTFSAHDAAFIDRILVLPFYTCFYKTEEQKERAKSKGSRYFIEAKDPADVVEAIKEERASVLYYLASRYQEIEHSIPESKESEESKNHYIDDNNDIFRFLKEFCEYSDKDDYFTPTKDLVNFYNEENNTRYSAKYVVLRLKEVYPQAYTSAKIIGKEIKKLTRGIRGIRLRYGAYPEGYTGNFTQEEIEEKQREEKDASAF